MNKKKDVQANYDKTKTIFGKKCYSREKFNLKNEYHNEKVHGFHQIFLKKEVL